MTSSLPSHLLSCWRTQRASQHHLRKQRVPVSLCATSSRSGTDLSVADSLRVLNLDAASTTDAAELRRAYYSRMREIHPDVNPEMDTTETAAQVNAAYAALLKVRCFHVRAFGCRSTTHGGHLPWR
jgi:hypothetical protein